MKRVFEFLKKNPEVRVEFMDTKVDGKIAVKMSRESICEEAQAVESTFRVEILEDNIDMVMEYLYEILEELERFDK